MFFQKFYIVLMFVASALAAASGPGTITGTISDWDGAPLAKADIKARNASGVEFQATSTVKGSYTLSALPAGTYQISIMAPGMKPYSQQNVVLQAAQTLRLDARIEDFETLNTLGDDREFLEDVFFKSHEVLSGPTPRTREGRPDFSGVWRSQRTVDPGNPELTPWAQALMSERQENHLRDIPSSRCLPSGVPWTGMFLPYRIVQTPSILALIYENDIPRQIYLDGRSHPKDWDPTYMGHSVGHWEGDELVVDTVGFNDKTWIDIYGHPHTEKLHVTERFRRPELGHLEIQITLEDPDAYKKPWTMWKISDLAPGTEEVGEYICAENNQDTPHMVGK
jgi:hypothetical protein